MVLIKFVVLIHVLKIDNKHGKMVKYEGFSAFLTTANTWLLLHVVQSNCVGTQNKLQHKCFSPGQQARRSMIFSIARQRKKRSIS